MFYCGGDYEARKGSGIGRARSACTPAGTATARSPARSSGPSAPSSSTSWRSWSTRSARWSWARAARASDDAGTPGPGRGRGPGDVSRCGTWLDLPDDTGFGVENLPYGIFSTPGPAAADRRRGRRPGARPGRGVDPADAGARHRHPERVPGRRPGRRGPRCAPAHRLAHRPRTTGPRGAAPACPRADVTLHLPFKVGRLRRLLQLAAPRRERRPDLPARTPPPLTPNWKHLPIGYHGRAGTRGRLGHAGRPAERPAQGPRRRRADVRAVDAAGHRGRGRVRRRRRRPRRAPPVPVGAFADHVFGVCLVNDWSARDLQAWEYVPLGPFLGKSFLTSVSPWVVPLAALEAARVDAAGRGTRRRCPTSTTPDRAVGPGPRPGGPAQRRAGRRARRSPGCTGRRRSSWRT